jgi:uncharacterized protein with PIN domain
VSDHGPFLLDVMCGKLATMLRFCGYDAAYALDRGTRDDDRLLDIARREDRTLLTRDVELAQRAGDRGRCLTERDTDDQLRELAAYGLDISLDSEPHYCGDCNGPVETVPDDDPTPEYAPSTEEFDIWRCRDCGQYFWKGSHWESMKQRLAAI